MRRAHPALRWLLAALGLVAFASLLKTADPERVLQAVRGAGPLVVLAAVPFFVATATDSLGWVLLIRVLGVKPRFLSVFRVRLSLEAMILTLPGGSVVAESSAPALLASRTGTQVRDAVVAVAARRW